MRGVPSALLLLITSVVMLLTGCGTVEMGLEPTPTPTPAMLRYENVDYGFAFSYPSHWSLEEEQQTVWLRRGTLALRIAYKRVDQAAPLPSLDMVASDGSISVGKLVFLGQGMPVEAMLSERKVIGVRFHTAKPMTADEPQFAIYLQDTAGDAAVAGYEDVDIPDPVVEEVGTILESFELVPRVAQVPTPTASPGPTPTPKGSAGALLPATASLEPEAEDSPAASLGDTQTRAVDGMAMVYVPAGEFTMGSDDDDVAYYVEMCQEYGPFDDCIDSFHFQREQPAHAVELDAFWIDRTEVTVAQYQACVDDGVCEAPPQPMGWSGPIDVSDDMPATVISWLGAQTYCEWAGGRLPTEAEWEYAARGPQGLRFPWGDTFDPSHLNFCDASCDAEWPKDTPGSTGSWAYTGYDDGYAYIAPVGSFPSGSSWCGALDMAGNAGEWTADWTGTYTIERQVNPTGPQGEGERKVTKGLSWYAFPLQVRSANREAYFPEGAGTYDGFRCVVPAD